VICTETLVGRRAEHLHIELSSIPSKRLTAEEKSKESTQIPCGHNPLNVLVTPRSRRSHHAR
jgi:hypothetical protein